MAAIQQRVIQRSGVSANDACRNILNHLDEFLELQKENAVAEHQGQMKDKIATDLAQIRFMLIGDHETKASQDHIDKIQRKFLHSEEIGGVEDMLMLHILRKAKYYPTDAQKEIGTILNFIIRRGNDNGFKQAFGKDYNPLTKPLLENYQKEESNPRLCNIISSIFREMMRDSELHTWIMEKVPGLRVCLFKYVKETNFDLASDAFSTLKMLLTKNKSFVAKYLNEDFDKFFVDYNQLIMSDNYVTRRQSLKLLGDVLLDRENKTIMMRYISQKNNLKLLMMMLRDKSKAITFEAFHVFKVFVANPHQSPEIYRTLWNNKAKLIKFLKKFQTEDRQDDNQFMHEKQLLIKKLEQMTKDPDAYEDAKRRKAEKMRSR